MHVVKKIFVPSPHNYLYFLFIHLDEKAKKQKGSSISFPSFDTKYECVSAYTRIKAEVGSEA
jgi:hypothetical protein